MAQTGQTKEGTAELDAVSRLTIGGGRYCRDDPVGIRTGKGERLIVETVGVWGANVRM